MKNLKGIMIPAEFTNLPFAEQLILWGVRLWVRALKDEANNGTSVHGILQNGFKLAGVPNAHIALNGLMTVIASLATGNIDIRCPKCIEISEDEHLLMGAIATLQYAGSVATAASYIAPWFSSVSIYHTYKPMAELAFELKNAGLFIRQRCQIQRPPSTAHLPKEVGHVPVKLH